MNKGERIKALRNAKGISQEELAKMLDISKQAVGKYESNIVTNIPSDKIEAMAVIFGTTPDYIMGWDKVEKENEDAVDILVKLGADKDFANIVMRAMEDKEFYGLCKMLCNLSPAKIAGIKVMLDKFVE